MEFIKDAEKDKTYPKNLSYTKHAAMPELSKKSKNKFLQDLNIKVTSLLLLAVLSIPQL